MRPFVVVLVGILSINYALGSSVDSNWLTLAFNSCTCARSWLLNCKNKQGCETMRKQYNMHGCGNTFDNIAPVLFQFLRLRSLFVRLPYQTKIIPQQIISVGWTLMDLLASLIPHTMKSSLSTSKQSTKYENRPEMYIGICVCVCENIHVCVCMYVWGDACACACVFTVSFFTVTQLLIKRASMHKQTKTNNKSQTQHKQNNTKQTNNKLWLYLL